MLEVISAYTPMTIFWIAITIFVTATSKGGFPAGPAAISLLVLVFPGQSEPAKTAVAFLLPLLIVMDIIGFFLYRKKIIWRNLIPLIPGTAAGVILASILFVSKQGSLIYIPDRWFRFCIGVLGMGFVLYQAVRRWVIKQKELKSSATGPVSSGLFGFTIGIASTLANIAGPIGQMYFLGYKMEKTNFAATMVAYFFLLNVIKMVPFSLLGRIEAKNLLLGVWMLPLIPLGVLAGFGLVKILKQRHYIAIIYAALTVTSVMQIVRSFMG